MNKILNKIIHWSGGVAGTEKSMAAWITCCLETWGARVTGGGICGSRESG
jgi:hypothetical protein